LLDGEEGGERVGNREGLEGT